MSRDRRITITVAAAVLYILFAAPWAGLTTKGVRITTTHSGLLFQPRVIDPTYSSGRHSLLLGSGGSSGSRERGYELAMDQLVLELAVVCAVVAMAAPSVVPPIARFIRRHTGWRE